jgi:DNA (cytosine-5)-methyltransferase 1
LTAYYNEIDPYAAQWLRNLIAAGHIAPGVVDERSIVDVRPDDLAGFTQCHFFAGIGVWSYALRLAGWPDDRPVWTGSCPCQPFSAAGKRGGFDDKRHLWPEFYRLIAARRPPVVFGEQVASKDGLAWLDAVQADLEGADYTSAAADICAAGVGAPHIRQRLYWVADSSGLQPEQPARERTRPVEAQSWRTSSELARRSDTSGLGHANGARLEGFAGHVDRNGGRAHAPGSVAETGEPCGMADASSDGHLERDTRSVAGRQAGRLLEPAGMGDAGWSSPTNSFWRDADWLFCRDGKWRPVEPGTFPLVNGSSARVGRLRAYGNAIVPQVAETFVRAYLEWNAETISAS